MSATLRQVALASLRQVALASGSVASAQQALREAAIAARDSGASISAIADAAGTTRQTIYRWVAQETGEAGGSPAVSAARRQPD